MHTLKLEGFFQIKRVEKSIHLKSVDTNILIPLVLLERFLITVFFQKVILYLSRDMSFLTMWYVRQAKPQISRRIRAG